MPFILHTPEALLPRSDSKNPATTCKGITSNGRPCRRALAASPRSSPGASPATGNGILAVLSGGEEDGGAAVFFCWQHKEQAVKLKEGGTGEGNTTLLSSNRRTSVDTLIDRLGVLDVEDHTGKASKRRQATDNGSPVQREKMPKQRQNVNGPLLAVSKDRHDRGKTPADMAFGRQTKPRRPPRRESDDTDDAPAPRIRHHTKPSPEAQAVSHSPPSNHNPTQPVFSAKPTSLSYRPSLPRDPPSQTQNLLTLIPPYLTPQTTSTLLGELAKPISDFDEEGFIYMFWLTDASSATTPSAQTASSLLSPTSTPNMKGRRASDLLHDFSSATSNSSAQKTILLKIGRASNVQRRMNEWTRQCGYNLSLIRYYPYLPSSPSDPPTPSKLSPSQARNPPLTPPLTPRKVRHAHRVERLIHIELGDKRVKKVCESCGKEHREWFEVEASRNGVAAVDEVVRRWVGWAEGRK
ncbi:MAG: hypothetical protein LQ347_003976 [Umbilicaria vellea]|nr:MAG: hypothetical protein LQ347_003976 [Umbilicaria vellea]